MRRDLGIGVVSERIRKLSKVRYSNSAGPLVTGLGGVGAGFILMGDGVPKNEITKGFRHFVVADETSVALAFYENGNHVATVRRFDEHQPEQRDRDRLAL